ncbi:anillin isoform X2 [Ptiloglossa arizonensis]|uniref:anillin isoform X2 n=1 Tax=Ptiloglossa arizonensis TaxID=3350558 RepID=UPI003FA05FA8
MDPFTQRMLERARARREKLDTQLSNAGHDVKKRRSPLKDANAILAQATVTKSKTPTKSPAKVSAESISSIKSPRKSVSKSGVTEKGEQINKENGEIGLYNVRSKLQRLGKLYSDDSSRELSSPIHRTEERFNAEEETTEQKPSKKGARLDRLAALASTINNWEDDISHPSLVKPVDSKADKIQAKLNEQVKSASESQPSTSGYSRGNRNSKGISPRKDESCSTKHLKWDKAVLETLEAQGFSRTKSNSRLVYDYKACSQGKDAGSTDSSPKQLQRVQEIAAAHQEKYDKNVKDCPKNINTKTSNTPEKTSKNATSSTNNSRLTPRFGFNGSPKSPAQSSPGSVLSKASLFESKHAETKAKDPAQMTLSERMALFEKNKGEAPLLPKAPLTMSIPPKKLQEKDKTSSTSNHANHGDSVAVKPKTDIPNNSVNAQREKFEQGLSTQELENNILRNTHMERQRELDMLRSRFNRNKERAQAAAGSCIRTSESSEGKSNSPKNSPVCPVKPTPAPDYGIPPPPPPLPQLYISNGKSISNQSKNSPAKRQVVGSPPKMQQIQTVSDVKRIRVAPPKPGHLYPNLFETENTTETETDTEYTVNSTEVETATLDEKTDTETGTEAEYYVQNDETEVDSEEECEEVNTSLGRSILRAVNEQAFLTKKRSIDPDPDSTTSDISVLDEMDEYLDECLALQETRGNGNTEEGPTPPKLNKGGKSPSTASTSFKYSQGSSYRSPVKKVSSASPKTSETYIVDGDNCIPLMHSVSFYRRQQSQTPKTPVRVISRIQEPSVVTPDATQVDVKNEITLVQEKVKRLLDEVCKQQTVIGQASQALNLCTSTVEFNDSREQVEGERLLLVATHRRQAALNEVQRLKVEGTLRPVTPGSPEVQESGSLTVSAITLPLKREYLRNIGTNTCLHFVCLMRHLEEIVATPVVIAEPGDSCLRFPSTIKLHHLYNDFKITVEIYSLQTQPEVLPHEIKYHINNSNGCGNGNSNCNKKESRLVMPNVQSPAGPSAVRSPAFQLSGYVIFSLREVHRQQFTLNKVPSQSPLEGRLQMHVSCELSVSVEYRGFLTMFEDISGFGAWHRRWCLLKGSTLSYWKYPDDERKKTPIGSLDLQGISTTNVGLVSRDICARPNTFLLEMTRNVEPGDAESLIMIRNKHMTTIRHLLSADTKEDRLEWCSKLNKTLNLIHAWGGTSALS